MLSKFSQSFKITSISMFCRKTFTAQNKDCSHFRNFACFKVLVNVWSSKSGFPDFFMYKSSALRSSWMTFLGKNRDIEKAEIFIKRKENNSFFAQSFLCHLNAYPSFLTY